MIQKLRAKKMKNNVASLLRILKAKNLRLALAESVTCGLAAHKLSGRPGTSEVFMGSVVCYSPEVKQSVLSVSKRKIDLYSCESQKVTDILVKNLSKIIDADVYGAITGLAAPGGSETKTKPVGTVFISVLYKGKVYRQRKLFEGPPLEIKRKACEALYEMILEIKL